MLQSHAKGPVGSLVHSNEWWCSRHRAWAQIPQGTIVPVTPSGMPQRAHVLRYTWSRLALPSRTMALTFPCCSTPSSGCSVGGHSTTLSCGMSTQRRRHMVPAHCYAGSRVHNAAGALLAAELWHKQTNSVVPGLPAHVASSTTHAHPHVRLSWAVCGLLWPAPHG